jgi:hypothetical protein
MAEEPVIRRSIKLPYDHMLTVRATPWTIKRTAFALLPWAVVLALPANSRTRASIAMIASRFSPLLRQRIH